MAVCVCRLEKDLVAAGWVMGGTPQCPTCSLITPSLVEHWATQHGALRRIVEQMTRGALVPAVPMRSARRRVGEWLAANSRSPTISIRQSQQIRQLAAALPPANKT